jgi:anti-sigma-K factor RskA
VQHCTPEQLALAALREPLPASDTAHLETCERCRAEVASLQRGVDALAVPRLAAPGASVAPPPRVWEAIAKATGVAGADTGPEVVPFRSRRPVLLVAAAVLAGAVVGAGTVAVLQGRDDGEAVTAVALDPLAGTDASGRAEVVVRGDGTRVLQVDLEAPAPEDSYYEIWLIDRDVVGMFPLGVVYPGTQTVELPAGLDLRQYPLVDVSVEPLDGDPTHSGVSVARGELAS